MNKILHPKNIQEDTPSIFSVINILIGYQWLARRRFDKAGQQSHQPLRKETWGQFVASYWIHPPSYRIHPPSYRIHPTSYRIHPSSLSNPPNQPQLSHKLLNPQLLLLPNPNPLSSPLMLTYKLVEEPDWVKHIISVISFWDKNLRLILNPVNP